MSSLTTCLKRAGSALLAEDREAILKRSAVLRQEGATAIAAARQAVDEQLAAVRALMSDPAKESVQIEQKPAVIEDAGARKDSATKTGVQNFGEALPPSRRQQRASLDALLTDDDLYKKPLSEIWPVAENESIEDKFAAAVATAARAEVPAKPRVGYKLDRWVQKVKTVRELAQMIVSGKTTKEVMLAEMAKRRLEGFASKVALLEAIDRSDWKRVGEVREKIAAQRMSSGTRDIVPTVSVEIDGKTHWLHGGGSIADNLPAITELLGDAPQDKKMAFEVRGRGNLYFINKKGDSEYRHLKEFTTAEEASKFRRENYDDLVKAWDAVKARDNVTERDLRSDANKDRVGRDWRNGKDITAEQFDAKFGFKGGEFGKWVSQGAGAQERQWMLNRAYDALMDLATLIGIPPRAISLNGSLGIAFGSRGNGWASAHFEPNNLVINLTKTRGAGALAHEWFHALDNYFSRQRGGEVAFTGNQTEYNRDNFITHKPEPMMVRKDRPGQPISRVRLEAMREGNPSSAYLAADQWQPDPRHPEGVRPVVEERFADLVKALDAAPMTKRSSLIDKGKSDGYWSQTLERAARSFEAYIIAKMAERGQHNDYLANVTPIEEFGRDKGRYPYPTPAELKPVAEALDALFDTVKTRETDKGVALFSRDVKPERNNIAAMLRGSSGKGLPVRLAELLAKAYGDAGLHNVNVARNIDELPAALRKKLSGFGDDVRGAYFPAEDAIWVFSDKLSTPDEMAFVVLHEAFHRGLGHIFGDNSKRLLRQMYQTNKKLRDRADLVARELKVDRDTAIEEALADMAGEGQAQSLRGWARLAAMIRDWLNKLSDRAGLNLRFSDSQIESFVAAVARAGINQDPSAQALRDGFDPDGVHVFSDSDMTKMKRHPVTDTQAFKRWFGDSKVVDAEGRPLVVYHGTQRDWGDSTTFQGHVQFFSESAGYADAWANIKITQADGSEPFAQGKTIMPVYVSVRNPANLDAMPEIDAQFDLYKKGVVKNLIKAGYDGAFWTEPGPPGGASFRNWATFDPEQIKSAIGNSGQFDPANSDIRASRTASMMSGLNQQSIRDAVFDRLSSAGEKVSWWQKTIGTQYAKAQQHAEYRPVFEAVQRYIEDTSSLANEAADFAPSILPKLESLSDVWDRTKHGLSAEDARAIAAPVFKGTLSYARQGGKLVDFDTLAAEAEAMSTREKESRLLADNLVSEVELKRWKATPLDIYEGAIRNRYEREYLQPGVVFTRPELRSLFKLNDRQIDQYEEFRAAVNGSLDQVVAADVLRLLGDVPPELKRMAMDNRPGLRAAVEQFMQTKADAEADPEARDQITATWNDVADRYAKVDRLKARGYAPLMRFGKFFVSVKGEDGEQKFFGLYESRSQANKMARELGADPELAGRVEQGTMSQEAYKLFSGVPVESLEMFADALGAEKSAVFQEYLRLTKNNRSALKRLIKRKGTAGFSDDVTRVLASFVTSNARMAAGGLNLGTAKEAADKIRAGDLKDEAVKLVDSVQNPVETAATVRGLMFINFIGGSIASALVNTTQPVMMTLPYLSQWGGATKAAGRLLASARMAAGGKIDDKEMAAAMKRGEHEGIVSPQEIHHLTAEAMGSFGKNPHFKRLMFLWAAPFSVAEQFNRRVTFIAAYQTAKAEGIADPYEFAKQSIIETQGLYNKGNAPNLTRNAIGATALTFKQYSIHYLEWLGRMWNAGEKGSPERKAGQRAVLFAMALLLAAGGTEGLPFAEDMNDLFDTFMQSLGFDTSAKGWKRDFLANTLGLGDEAADVAQRGLSALPGIPLDVSIRMGMGNLLPGTGMLLKSNTDVSRDVLELAGPAGGLLNQYKEAGKKALDGDLLDAGLAAMPTALQNAGKGIKMWMNDEFRDTKGRKVMETDDVDAMMKLLGFQPAAVARESAKINQEMRRVQLARNVETHIADLWAQGVRERDADMVNEARQQLREWNETNPASRIEINSSQIKRRVKDMQSTRAERFEKTAPKELRGSVAEALQ